MPPYNDPDYPDILENLPDPDFCNFSLDFLQTNFMKQQWSQTKSFDLYVSHCMPVWQTGIYLKSAVENIIYLVFTSNGS